MSSRQKVLAALQRLDELDAAELDPAAQGLVLAGTMLRPKLVAMLPADPDELDRLLLAGAAWFLGMRSDDAEPFDPAALADVGQAVEQIDATAEPA
jgi:hypothetical protein